MSEPKVKLPFLQSLWAKLGYGRKEGRVLVKDVNNYLDAVVAHVGLVQRELMQNLVNDLTALRNDTARYLDAVTSHLPILHKDVAQALLNEMTAQRARLDVAIASMEKRLAEFK